MPLKRKSLCLFIAYIVGAVGFIALPGFLLCYFKWRYSFGISLLIGGLAGFTAWTAFSALFGLGAIAYRRLFARRK
jgi:MFS family permease